MGILLGDMVVRFTADTSGLTSGASSALGTLKNFAGGINPVVGALVGLGVAAVSVGVVSTKMAADYEQAMNKVKALTGSSTAQMTEYDAGLKKLAVDAGVAPKQLADGLYNVISAGFKGKEAMTVFTLATEDSKIGMTSAKVATDSLTNILNQFSVKSKDVTRVNGEMLQTVTLGKATFEQYATAIVKAASTSVQFHTSMETMNAAWATLTATGIKAGQATTDYDASLKVMDGNITAVAKSLAKNGIAFNETAFNAMDYGHKIVYMNSVLEEANKKHVHITGVTIQAAQAISDISNHISMYNSNLATLSNRQEMNKKTQEAWAITQAGFNQQMSRLSAAVQVLLIDLGSKLLPILTSVLSAITPLVVAFTDWIVSGKAAADSTNIFQSVMAKVGPIITLIGNFLASVFIPVWQQLVETFNTQLKPAFDQLITAIKPYLPLLGFLALGIAGVLVVALILLIEVLGKVLIIVIKVFGGIVQTIQGAIQIASGIIAFFADLTAGRFNKLGGDLKNIFTGISNMITGVWQTLANAAFGWAQNMISQFIGGIQSMFGQVGATMSSLVGYIGSFLPHSPAKQGELMHLNEYGPNLVKGIATGVMASAPSMIAAMNALTKPLTGSQIMASLEGLFDLNARGKGAATSVRTLGDTQVKQEALIAKHEAILDRRQVLLQRQESNVKKHEAILDRAIARDKAREARDLALGHTAAAAKEHHIIITLEQDKKKLAREVMTLADKELRLKVGNRSTRVA